MKQFLNNAKTFISKINVETIVKWTGFLIFVTVSMLASVNFLITFGHSEIEIGVLFVTAFGLEAFKIFTLIKAYQLWDNKGSFKKDNKFSLDNLNSSNLIKSVRKFILYFILASIAVFSSFSYGRTLIAQSKNINAIELIQSSTDTNNDITSLNTELNNLITSQSDAPKNLKQKLSDIDDRKKIAESELNALKNNPDTPQWKIDNKNVEIKKILAEKITAQNDSKKELEKLSTDIANKRAEIEAKRATKETQQATEKNKAETTKDTSNQLSVLSKDLGLDQDFIVNVFTIAVATVVEIGIFSMAPHGRVENNTENKIPELASENIIEAIVEEIVETKPKRKRSLKKKTEEIKKEEAKEDENSQREQLDSKQADIFTGNNEHGEEEHKQSESVPTKFVEPTEQKNESITVVHADLEQIHEDGDENSVEIGSIEDKNEIKKYVFGQKTVEYKDGLIKFVDELFERSENGIVKLDIIKNIIMEKIFDKETVLQYYKILEKVVGATGQPLLSNQKLNYSKQYIKKYLSLEL